MKETTTRLSIFDTFRTKTRQLTGEAIRQRSIITILVSNSRPIENTRTAVAQTLGKKNNVPWKNIYSGIFRDFDEVLVPLELVKESGRLPLKRGPKALQANGIPYYTLTKKGIIVALSFDSEIRAETARKFLDDKLPLLPSSSSAKEEKEVNLQIKMILELNDIVPKLGFTILENYVKAYCSSKITELVPFSIASIRQAQIEFLTTYKETFERFKKLNESEKEKLGKFLDRVVV